ncbi:MAG: DUF1738 domain-containing protein [Bacteroidaceae bacterium]|nr:DUF1738 domain-containing protein [Bacteroidaceae bacterium]
MATKKTQSAQQTTAEDRALERFTEVMAQRIETLTGDWKQPWFSTTAIPRNMSGRAYNGMNSIMLMLHCQQQGYGTPCFATFDRLAALNFTKNPDGTRTRTVDANGQPLPMVIINKGERSFPVFITTFTCVNKQTKEKISYDIYKMMDRDEQDEYMVFVKLNVFNVFNVISQTNIAEARPDLCKKIKAMFDGTAAPTGEMLPAVDKMINENLWVCPIKEVRGDNAYYSISRDEIVVPERSQFVSLESFQSNLFHECIHSTGAESRLGKLQQATFGSAEYSKEELNFIRFASWVNIVSLFPEL